MRVLKKEKNYISDYLGKGIELCNQSKGGEGKWASLTSQGSRPKKIKKDIPNPDKYQRRLRKLQSQNSCCHCGKPCAPYAECEERRAYKRMWARNHKHSDILKESFSLDQKIVFSEAMWLHAELEDIIPSADATPLDLLIQKEDELEIESRFRNEVKRRLSLITETSSKQNLLQKIKVGYRDFFDSEF